MLCFCTLAGMDGWMDSWQPYWGPPAQHASHVSVKLKNDIQMNGLLPGLTTSWSFKLIHPGFKKKKKIQSLTPRESNYLTELPAKWGTRWLHPVTEPVRLHKYVLQKKAKVFLQKWSSTSGLRSFIKIFQNKTFIYVLVSYVHLIQLNWSFMMVILWWVTFLNPQLQKQNDLNVLGVRITTFNIKTTDYDSRISMDPLVLVKHLKVLQSRCILNLKSIT